MLLFELDAALCPSPSRPIDSFKGFALVGAPWQGSKGCCNSGLSLWHRASMLRLIAMRGHTYSGEQIDTNPNPNPHPNPNPNPNANPNPNPSPSPSPSPSPNPDPDHTP